jgi:hypothetical protein
MCASQFLRSTNRDQQIKTLRGCRLLCELRKHLLDLESAIGELPDKTLLRNEKNHL